MLARLVVGKRELYSMLSYDSEVLHKDGRPLLLVLHLTFRGDVYDFAVPVRSNVGPRVPQWQYFALPPHPGTLPGSRHAIHYIKMFPVDRSRHLDRFVTGSDPYYLNLVRYIDAHMAQIVCGCQDYLDRYAQEGRPRFAVDIDAAIAALRLAPKGKNTRQRMD